MPHAEIKYSADLVDLNVAKLLSDLEQLLVKLDPNSGPCKGRAYPAAVFHHTHILINIQLFATKERDMPFINRVLSETKSLADAAIAQPCFITVELSFSPITYYTGHNQELS